MDEPKEKDDIKEASQRLASREHIHQMLTIEEPKNWLTVTVIIALILVLIIWSFWGRIPTEATGRSVALSPQGVFLIRSKSVGLVSEIFVREGEVIEENTPIARIYNPALRSNLTAIEASKYKIEKLTVELALLNHAYKINSELYEEGLIAKMVLDDSKASILNKQITIEEAKSDLSTLYSDLENISPTYNADVIVDSAIILSGDTPIDLEELEKELSTVTASSKGRVLEVLVNIGDTIDQKESLIWMERPHGPNELELFYAGVDADIIGKIDVDMKVLIEPNIVNPQEYGAIVGKVLKIYPYPVSKDELTQTIGNLQIVDFLLGKSKTITNLLIEPLSDPTTPSGFKWTSNEGPPFEIPTGTICRIKIVIDEQPPISYLIPLWKIKMR